MVTGIKEKPITVNAAAAAISPRELPYNIEAEQILLGNLMVNNDDLNKVSDFLIKECFYEPVHQKLYEALQKFHDKAIIANPITLKNFFENDESLKARGGENYLGDLAALSVNIISVYDYGRAIYELALKRNLIEIGKEIVNEAYIPDLDITAHMQIERAEQRLYNLSTRDLEQQKGFMQLKKPLLDAINKAQSAYQNKGKVSGISSNFIDLDEILGGFQDSDLIIMAGRPSMGKTAVSINLAYNACKNLVRNHQNHLKNQTEDYNETKPKSVGFFSLEMSSEQIATRMLSMISGVNSTKLRTGHIDEDEFADIARATKELQDLPFYIDDTPSLSVSALRTRARRLKRMHNLGIIFVDYLQLLRADAFSGREMNRVQEISEITQGLKAIAKELNIPVIALSQLSRAVEQREDKKPLLSDLRESGSIEQDADIVIFIYREEYYLMRKKPKEGSEEYAKWQAEMEAVASITELIISKHRNGPIGTARLLFDAQHTKFNNLTTNYENLS